MLSVCPFSFSSVWERELHTHKEVQWIRGSSSCNCILNKRKKTLTIPTATLTPPIKMQVTLDCYSGHRGGVSLSSLMRKLEILEGCGVRVVK